jgi:[protein-PII] uridylyltransferase
VLDTFFVHDARSGNLAGAEQRDKFEKVINQALTGEEVDFPALIAKQKIARPVYQAYAGEQIPTRIYFDNEASETRTLLEIETEDRIGLLYAMSQKLSELTLDVAAAKISTEKGAAIDSFYVREMDGSKVISPERHHSIERRLRQAIHALDAK